MMQILKSFIIFVSIITTHSAENCDKLGILLYEDLGCTPHYDDSKSCPTKYNCPHLEPWKNECYFRGKTYQNGEEVTESPCNKGCVCSSFTGKQEAIQLFPRAQFRCPILDCPEWLGSPLTPGCYRTYVLDRCCSTGQRCPPFHNIQKCLVDGVEYHEGQTFSPVNTCLQCICEKGFKGKFEEPFCKRKSCNVQLRRAGENVQNGCAPLYNKKSESEVWCCPYNGWICPDGSEEIKGDAKKDDTCKFGDKTLKIGQKFEKLNFTNSYGRKFGKIECECLIPPLLTCSEV